MVFQLLFEHKSGYGVIPVPTPSPMLPERPTVLLRALSVRLAMTLTIEELAGLLGGEVLTSLHGLALLSLLRVATMLLSVMLLAVVVPASMLTSVSHYNIMQD